MSLESIYREQIMDHFKSPRNYGKMDSCTFKFTDQNPFCGDELEIFVKVENDRISDIKFTGKGCSISQAAASMLTEVVKGKTIDDVKKITREDVIQMLGIPIGVVRVKCAVLSLVTLKNGIAKFNNGE